MKFSVLTSIRYSETNVEFIQVTQNRREVNTPGRDIVRIATVLHTFLTILT